MFNNKQKHLISNYTNSADQMFNIGFPIFFVDAMFSKEMYLYFLKKPKHPKMFCLIPLGEDANITIKNIENDTNFLKFNKEIFCFNDEDFNYIRLIHGSKCQIFGPYILDKLFRQLRLAENVQ